MDSTQPAGNNGESGLIGSHELARAAGVAVRTLERWHLSGALPAAASTLGGSHRWAPADVARARLIAGLRRSGIGPRRAGVIARDVLGD